MLIVISFSEKLRSIKFEKWLEHQNRKTQVLYKQTLTHKYIAGANLVKPLYAYLGALLNLLKVQ